MIVSVKYHFRTSEKGAWCCEVECGLELSLPDHFPALLYDKIMWSNPGTELLFLTQNGG